MEKETVDAKVEVSGPAEEVEGKLAGDQVDETPSAESLQSEIERLQAVRKKAQEDAEYWRRQKVESRADYFKGRHVPQDIPPAVQSSIPEPLPGIGEAPKQADFDDYDKYLDARMAFETRKAKAEWTKEEEHRKLNQNREQKLSAAREKILTEGMEKYPDFEEVALDNSVPITPLVMDLLAESDMPTELAYYLGKNRNIAVQVARSTPIKAARILAKIEAELKQAGGPVPPSPRIPGAPPPIRPLGSSRALEKDPGKMTQREYEEWRSKQGARRF